MPGTTPRGYDYPLYAETQDFPAAIQELAEDVDADMDALYDGNTAARNEPTAIVAQSFNVALPTATDVTTTFDTELYDNAAMVNLGVSPQVVTITSTGLYLVSATINTDVDTGSVAMFVRSVAGLVPDIATVTKGGGLPFTDLNTVALTRCAAAETIRIIVRQNSGALRNIISSRLSVTKVAP